MLAAPKLHKLGIPTKRPDDYFAEMVKTDEHMQRVSKMDTIDTPTHPPTSLTASSPLSLHWLCNDAEAKGILEKGDCLHSTQPLATKEKKK